MNTPPQYTVMGEDGKEYGPVNAEQIRAWIAEERLEKKTPVKPAEARDWMFLQSLPEFAKAFEKVAQSPPHPGKRRARKWLLLLGFIVLAELVFIILKMLEVFPAARPG
jgi:hypothetical protein